MTSVADFGEYTGVDGVITIDDIPLADVQYDVKWTRSTVSHSRGGKHSDINLPGKFTVKTKIKKALVYADAAKVLGYSLTDTPLTGTAGVCLAATTITAGTAVGITTDPATPSRIKLTTSVAATTLAGAITIVGTDANDVEISETIAIPAGTPSGTEFVTTKVFKLAAYALPIDITSTGGAKFALDALAGSATYTVGDPKIFDLVGSLPKGATEILITQPDCWFSSGGINWEDAGKVIDVDSDVEMRDPDALTVTVS